MEDTESDDDGMIQCWVGPLWFDVNLSDMRQTVLQQIDEWVSFEKWRSLTICRAPPYKPVLLYDHTNAASKKDEFRALFLALCMGAHARLGARSPLFALSRDLLQNLYARLSWLMKHDVEWDIEDQVQTCVDKWPNQTLHLQVVDEVRLR